MFTLAISCLTTSNLPWFMNLEFQVPMQYCSLQNWTLLSPPDTSMTGHHFHFGSVSSFSLELFLQLSPVPYWAPTILGRGGHLSVSYLLPFDTAHGILKARMLKRSAIPFSSGPHPLASTISQSLLRFIPIESVMLSNHLILWGPLLLLPSVFPSIKVFSSELALHIRWPKFWSFSFSIGPSNEYSELISFRIDRFNFLAVQGTLKSLL